MGPTLLPVRILNSWSKTCVMPTPRMRHTWKYQLIHLYARRQRRVRSADQYCSHDLFVVLAPKFEIANFLHVFFRINLIGPLKFWLLMSLQRTAYTHRSLLCGWWIWSSNTFFPQRRCNQVKLKDPMTWKLDGRGMQLYLIQQNVWAFQNCSVNRDYYGERQVNGCNQQSSAVLCRLDEGKIAQKVCLM